MFGKRDLVVFVEEGFGLGLGVFLRPVLLFRNL
jgi:hypothetical protein